MSCSDSRRTNPGHGATTVALAHDPDGPRFAALRVPWDATVVDVQLLGPGPGQLVAAGTAALDDCCPS